MKNTINQYKEISNEIIVVLSNKDIDTKKLDKYFQDRDMIIDRANKEGMIDEFRAIYTKDLYYIDLNIKELLYENMNKVKKELIEYKKSKNVNLTYTNMSKNSLNIFIKKV